MLSFRLLSAKSRVCVLRVSVLLSGAAKQPGVGGLYQSESSDTSNDSDNLAAYSKDVCSTLECSRCGSRCGC